MFFRGSAQLSFLLMFGCLPVVAQSTPALDKAPEPLVRSRANAVALDVVVTQRGDRPVVALHQQDFIVMEDGKPQSIDFFEEHTSSETTVAPPPALPPHVFSNQLSAPSSGAVNVLLLDSLNTSEADQAYVHKQITSFVLNMNSNTRVAIFALNTRLRMLQGFTADSALLKAALSGKTAAPGTTPDSRTRDDDLRDKEELSIIQEMVGNTDGFNQAATKAIARSQADVASTQGGKRSALTLAALQQLARTLAAVPGRKNLIWFASSFPVSVFPNGGDRQTLSNGKEIPDAVRQTVDLLTQSKIAIYPVSAQGILADPTTNADTSGQPAGDDFEKAPLQQTSANSANMTAMTQLATDTGGEALYTTNDLSKAMASAMDNGAHYYTLVYTPTNAKMDGRFRRIDVKMSQGRYKLAYRRGYYADDASGITAAAPASDPLAPLLARGMPDSTQIVYQARLLAADPQPAADQPRAGGNAKLSPPLTRYKVDFVIPVADLNLNESANGEHSGKVEIALIAYGKDDAAVNWTAGQMSLTLNAASYAAAQKSGLPAHLQLDLPNADIYLATGVYSIDSHRAGTLEIPLRAR